MLKTFVADNIWSILVLVFTAGGAYGMLIMHENQISTIEEKILEIELNKVSATDLELQKETLAHQLQTLKADNEIISNRVRRAIDSDVKPIGTEVHLLDVQTQIQEARIKQMESELKNLWKFTNKFLEEK